MGQTLTWPTRQFSTLEAIPTFILYLSVFACLLQNGITPLFSAVRYSRREVVTLLLEQGANPNLADQVIDYHRDIIYLQSVESCSHHPWVCGICPVIAIDIQFILDQVDIPLLVLASASYCLCRMASLLYTMQPCVVAMNS